MTKEEKDNLIQLLKSNDRNNHELALTMFIGLGGNVDEFILLYVDNVVEFGKIIAHWLFDNEFYIEPSIMKERVYYMRCSFEIDNIPLHFDNRRYIIPYIKLMIPKEYLNN